MKQLSKQKDILVTLVRHNEWASIREIMALLDLEYSNNTARVVVQRKLKQLHDFGFVMMTIQKNKESNRKGWGHKLFKAKKRGTGWIK